MRIVIRYLAIVIGVGAGNLATAQEIFLESDWQNTIPAPSVAIWSGGDDTPIGGLAFSSGDAPIASTGYNLDVVVENTATLTPELVGTLLLLQANTYPYAQPFARNAAFYEAGLNLTPTSGISSVNGLPQGGDFTSILDGVTTFQLQPYNSNNVLYLNQTSPEGTLTLAEGFRYNSVSILAASGTGGGNGTFVITFSDSTTSQPINFSAPDWSVNNPGAALTNVGQILCSTTGSTFSVSNGGNLYQTTINLASLALNQKPIVSLTFTMPNGAGTSTNTVTGVFAVSGTPIGPPHSASGFYLVEAEIGQMTSGTLGYPQAATDLSNSVYAARFGPAGYQRYHYSNGLAGVATNPAVTWSIVFPGGFNPANGQVYGNAPGAPINYDTNGLDQALYDVHAWLRVSPYDTNAAQQLFLLQEDAMQPLEWCGTEALAYADTARLLGLPPVNGTNQETLAIELARGYFRAACDVFAGFLDNPPDATLAEGLNAFLSSSVTNQVADVLEDYLRNLSEYAEASLTDFQIRSLAEFYDPSQQSGGPLPAATQALLNDIDNAYGEIQMRLLLASPFQNLPVYTLSAAGQVQSVLAQISRMHESVVLGRITFIAGDSGDASTNTSLYYGEYTTSFVPIFSGLPNPQGGNSSFDIALNQANQFLSYAANLELAASNEIATVTKLAYAYSDQVNTLEQQYDSQLVALCGYYNTDTNGNPVPDLLFAALPPGQRENMGAQYATNANYQLVQTGSIYQEWLAVQQAETNLVLASLNLSNTMATIIEKNQVGNEYFSNQVYIATVITSDGHQIAGLQVQQGEVQANADQQIAQIQATGAEEAGVGPAVNGAVQGAKEGAPGGPVGAIIGGLIGAGLSLFNTYSQVSADLKIGNVQADTARQLADLNSQISGIQSSEQARLQILNGDQYMLNLSADLNSLRMQAQSQAVQIQLAAQGVDQERNKIATMLGQVAYLLQQFTRAVTMVDQNPDLSDNLLIARSAAIQRANDSFVLAQQWAFLAAQAFAYKDNSPGSPAPGYVQAVLAARNTAALHDVLNNLGSDNTALAATYQNAPNFDQIHFSVRNDFVQANAYLGSGSNTVVTSYEPTSAGTNAAASQAAWVSYLVNHLVTNEFGVSLQLDFSTSLARSEVAGTQRNPLWKCDAFGGLLYSGTDNGNTYKGVQMSLTTTGLTFSDPLGAEAGFWVHLSQLGASSIRRVGYANQSVQGSQAIRVFNFEPFSAEFTASANNLLQTPGTDAFSERSPANDHWQLVIFSDEASNNNALLSNLDKLSDIELLFAVHSFTDQIAEQNCVSGP